MTSETMTAYYATGSRGMMEGVPIWRPKWWAKVMAPRVPRETYNKDLYPEGTIRIKVEGVPYRVAAHVKTWKKANREALLQGFDPYGLTLLPHNRHGLITEGWGLPGTPINRLWQRYGLKAWDLSHDRRDAEWALSRVNLGPPDLWQWARVEERRLKARGIKKFPLHPLTPPCCAFTSAESNRPIGAQPEGVSIMANKAKTPANTPLPPVAVVGAGLFSMPEREHKYPWQAMKEGEVAIFGDDTNGMPDTDYERITRSVTAYGKKAGIQFRVRKLAPETKINDERTLHKGGLAVMKVGNRAPKARPQTPASAPAQAQGQPATAAPAVGEVQMSPAATGTTG